MQKDVKEAFDAYSAPDSGYSEMELKFQILLGSASGGSGLGMGSSGLPDYMRSNW